MQELEPGHKYKLQLVENLKAHYTGRGWKLAFAFNRDEILFILPDGYDARKERDGLIEVLESLPEIDYPKERVRIAFWVESEARNCTQIEIINPNVYDHKHYAIGPDSFLNSLELEKYIKIYLK
jgi:hypothetical protein